MKLWIIIALFFLSAAPSALSATVEGSADDAPAIVIYGKDDTGTIRPIRTDADGVVQTA